MDHQKLVSRRQVLTLGVATGITTLLAACTSTPATPAGSTPLSSGAQNPTTAATAAVVTGQRKTLRVLSEVGGDAGKFHEENIYTKFRQKYPNIDLKVEAVPWGNDMLTKIQTQAAGGTLADVFGSVSLWHQTFIANGVTLPIDQYIKTDNYDYNDNKQQTVAQTGFEDVDGKVHGLIFEVATFAAWYVPAIFEAAGVTPPTPDWTIDDLTEKALALTKREGDKTVLWGVGNGPSSGWGREAFMMTAGAPMIANDRKTPQINTPNAVKLIQAYQDLRFKHKVMPAQADYEALKGAGQTWQQGIWEGKVAMAFDCCGGLRSINQFAKQPFVMLPLPKMTQAGNSTAGSGYGVYKNSQSPGEAAAFLFNQTDPENQKAINKALGWIPSRDSARKAAATEWKGNPENYFTQMNTNIGQATSISIQLVPGKSVELGTIDGQRMTQIWNEGKPVKEVLDQIQADFEKAIARKE